MRINGHYTNFQVDNFSIGKAVLIEMTDMEKMTFLFLRGSTEGNSMRGRPSSVEEFAYLER